MKIKSTETETGTETIQKTTELRWHNGTLEQLVRYIRHKGGYPTSGRDEWVPIEHVRTEAEI